MKNPEGQPSAEEEEVREIDGQMYRRRESGYTIREWYSHSGPGWDTRWRVLEEHGVNDPSELPDDPHVHWELIEEDK